MWSHYYSLWRPSPEWKVRACINNIVYSIQQSSHTRYTLFLAATVPVTMAHVCSLAGWMWLWGGPGVMSLSLSSLSRDRVMWVPHTRPGPANTSTQDWGWGGGEEKPAFMIIWRGNSTQNGNIDRNAFHESFMAHIWIKAREIRHSHSVLNYL